MPFPAVAFYPTPQGHRKRAMGLGDGGAARTD
jgi:hypothetical protein